MCRYLLRVTISRPYGASVVRDFPFWVRNHRQPEPQASLPPVKVRSAALQRYMQWWCTPGCNMTTCMLAAEFKPTPLQDEKKSVN